MIKIPNIILLNYWGHKKFLQTIVAINLVMLGSIGLDFMGLEIPILRQVIGFIYLTFVPGIIILRLLKLHGLSATETVLLSTGLSISLLMFSGFFLNTLLSFLNIDSPLSFLNVVIFITALLAILSIFVWKIDRFGQYELPPLKIPRSAFYLVLLPVLSIIGTYFVNFQNNNIILLILIVSIALVPFLVAFNRINPELFPLAVFVIGLSLLYLGSLNSMYLPGWDINTEYYFHKLVFNNAYWNSEIFSNVNAMLSIVILPAFYSYFLKMDGAWVFKIVYPIIFSLVPLGLYCVYKRQINSEKIAFFSVFFFMSFGTFFAEMLSLARQQIAELFFVLLIFLMVQDTLNRNIRNILYLVFGASLVVSHYGLSYIYMILMIFIYLLSLDMIRTLKTRRFTLPEYSLKKLTLSYFFAFYIVFLLLWYIYFTRSSAFISILNIVDNIFANIFTEFFNPENTDRNVLMALGMADPLVHSIGRDVHRGLQLITQFFIIIGFFKIIIYREFIKLKAEYFYLIIASFLILLLSLLPFAAKSFNMTRIYHIALFSLSPLFIIGGIFVMEKTLKIINIKNKLKQNHAAHILILCVLVPYFLFNIGFVYEITNDSITSISLGMEKMKNDNISKIYFYGNYIQELDVFGARWYDRYKGVNEKIYADGFSRINVLTSYGMEPNVYRPITGRRLMNENLFPRTYYIYLGKFNVCYNTFVASSNQIYNTSILSPLTTKLDRVYSNGCGEIYQK